MRVQTDEDLMTAFEILCGKKEPEKITAMEVAKRAGVTRSTFYNHFADMPTLIETYEDQILDGIFDILSEYGDMGKNGIQFTRKFFSTLCRYVRNSNYLIRRFRKLTTVRFIEKALIRFHGYVESMLSRQASTPAAGQLLYSGIRARRAGRHTAQVDVGGLCGLAGGGGVRADADLYDRNFNV